MNATFPDFLPDAKEPVRGPRYLTPFGFLRAMNRDPLAFLTRCRAEYGDVVRVRAFPVEMWICAHPREVKHILHTNHRNYWKGSLSAKVERVAGKGLVFSDADLWRRQRQLVQPAFQRDRISALAPMMVDCCARMLDRWEGLAARREPVEISSELSLLTLEIAARALFGTDLGDDRVRFRSAIEGALTYADHLLTHFATPPLAVPTPANWRARKHLSELDALVWKVIDEHRRDPGDRGDLLSMLIAARDEETRAAMDDRQLRDECVTFIVAGHETTAMALSWAQELLAGDSQAQSELHAEVSRVLGSGTPALGDLGGLIYTRMVFDESMRLYPPVWGLARESHEEDELGGHRIPGGTVIALSPYLTHRHPDFWEEPETFDPERFRPERSAERPEHAFIPFGGGPRRCVGMQFALMEAQIVLSMISQRFSVRRVPGRVAVPWPILTLKPRDGIWLTLHARH